MSIEKIRLDAFRGATKEVAIKFDPEKRVTLIFGENGNGKSTIIDGFTFLCNQSRGSLDDRAGSRSHKFLVSSGRSSKDLFVELKTSANSIPWMAKLSGSQIQVGPESGYPHLKVLRRATISNFIEADPKDKYEELKNFIETPGIEKSEQALRDAERITNQELTELVRDYTNAENSLASLWEQEGKKDGNALVWAKRISQQSTDDLKKEKDSIDKFDALVSGLKSELAVFENLAKELKKAESNFKEALEKQKAEEGKAVGQTGELLDVLQSAKKYIQNNMGVKECPVCIQGINPEELKSSLTQRISSLDKLSSAVALANAKKKALDRTKSKIEETDEKVFLALESIETFAKENKAFLKGLPEVNQSESKILKDKSLSLEKRSEAGAKLLEPLLMPFKDRYEEIQKNLGLKNAVSLQLNSLTDCQKKQKTKEDLNQRLNKVLHVVESERKKFVEEVLKSISGEICSLMEIIHPGESMANIELILDQKRKGSLHIKGDVFSETGAPPQAYLSESHLDTLGICIWLSFTRKFSPSDALVILDDVLTSVDSPHLDRIITMLDEVAQDFGHVILTTHYRLWRDRYRFHQAANSNIHFIELKEWAHDRGIISDTNLPLLEELQEWLKPEKFDRQIVASKAGIFLESILDYLSLLYMISLPRKASQDYTLGDYLNGFSSKKRALIKIEHLDEDSNIIDTVEIKPILDDLDSFTWIRNKIGCHFSVSGQEASDTDIKSFAEKVIELGHAVICRDGGDIPKKNKSGSFYQSSSGKCRLYPLQMP